MRCRDRIWVLHTTELAACPREGGPLVCPACGSGMVECLEDETRRIGRLDPEKSVPDEDYFHFDSACDYLDDSQYNSRFNCEDCGCEFERSREIDTEID